MENLLTYQVEQLLSNNKIPFDKEELAFQIQSHPSYPSLHAVTGVLDHFNIDNLALDVPVDEETLEQLPESILVELQVENGKALAVIQRAEEHIDVIYSPKKRARLLVSEFLKQFTGIIVAVEGDEDHEKTATTKKYLDHVPMALTVVLCMAVIAISGPSLTSSLYFLLGSLGIYLSVIIIKEGNGLQTTLGSAICSQGDEKKDCHAVLSSEGAKLPGNYKLSDLSIVYFSTQFLACLLLLVSGANFIVPYAISILALPITIYSIYYQYAVAKQWCYLCLSIVALIWLQAGLVIFGYDLPATLPISPESILLYALALLATIWAWRGLAPNISKLQSLWQTKLEFYKFKKNYHIFSFLLRKSSTVDTIIPDATEIVLGNNDSPLSIVIVTNPFCKHCAAVHTLIEDIYKSYPENVKISIRFNIDLGHPDSDLVRITSRLLEIYNGQGTVDCMEAMHDIYNGQHPQEWLNKWQDCTAPEQYHNLLKKQSEWCTSSNINFTPEILINGKSFPTEYDRSDLIYFIEDLSEHAINHMNENTHSLE